MEFLMMYWYRNGAINRNDDGMVCLLTMHNSFIDDNVG